MVVVVFLLGFLAVINHSQHQVKLGDITTYGTRAEVFIFVLIFIVDQ